MANRRQGKDSAAYGERLLPALAQRLAASGLKQVDARQLRRFRLFYSVYPQIRETLSPEWLAGSGAEAFMKTKATLDQATNAVVPKLRFPEGRHDVHFRAPSSLEHLGFF